MVVFSPMLGQRSFLRTPQDANISVAIPIIAINFAFFMISELIHKINAFEGISIALSEIILQKTQKSIPGIAEIQKKFGEFAPLALEQYKLKIKAQKKLPHFSNQGCLFWQRAFEQATSEYVALWKASQFRTTTLLSLTGGLGVDEWAWHQQGCEVISCDIQKDLNQLVRFNQKQLGIAYKRYDTEAIDLLEKYKNQKIERVYIDPDRRNNAERLGGYWESFQPRIDALIDRFRLYYPSWLIKMSPMTDFRVLRNALPGSITFYSVYHDGEVKELLLDVNPNEEQKEDYIAINIDSQDDFSIFSKSTINKFLLSKLTSNQASQDYIFEPHGGINNLNLNDLLIDIPNITALTHNKTLFRTSYLMPKAWGRCKQIQHTFEGGVNEIAKQLKELGILEASVTTRETNGLKAEEIQLKLKLKQSQKNTLFVTRTGKKFKAWLAN